jgi:hypothetical protein
MTLQRLDCSKPASLSSAIVPLAYKVRRRPVTSVAIGT